MMSGGRDGTKIIGPFDAATVIDMLESGAIDKDSSLISNYPDDFWEVFTPDKELALHKAVRSQARVAPLVLPATEPEEDTESRTERPTTATLTTCSSRLSTTSVTPDAHSCSRPTTSSATPNRATSSSSGSTIAPSLRSPTMG